MFECTCALRWSDLDAQGHVNNAVVVDYLQEARVAFLKDGGAGELLDRGVVVVSHQVEYLKALEYDPDGVQIELVISQLGGARFEVAYELRQHRRLAVRARSILCPFDFEANAPKRLPEEVREYFSKHRVEVAPLAELAQPALSGRGTGVPVPVRWSDLDSYGHVNNAKTYDYLQQARIQATTAWDPSMARAGAVEASQLWLVARQDVRYLQQLPHRRKPYEVRVSPSRIGNTSLTLASELVCPQTATVYSRATTVLVCADENAQPVPLRAHTRKLLSQLLVT